MQCLHRWEVGHLETAAGPAGLILSQLTSQANQKNYSSTIDLEMARNIKKLSAAKTVLQNVKSSWWLQLLQLQRLPP